MMKTLSCFNASDIRGVVGDNLTPDIAWQIGKAFGEWMKPGTVVMGRDNRLSGERLQHALTAGLCSAGVSVLDLGMTGTEEVYFATSALNAGAGIQVTASHNPANYNGMKIVLRGSLPFGNENGLGHLAQQAVLYTPPAVFSGHASPCCQRDSYIHHILSFISPDKLKKLTIVVNAGNGMAGQTVDAIERCLSDMGAQATLIKLNHLPDGRFPKGPPNPLLPENRHETAHAVRINRAHLGVAFDGDFDRCFLFDENGDAVENYYLTGLLAECFLNKHPGATIVHDPRLIWETESAVNRAGGKTVCARAGHAYIKNAMRRHNAVYGGESSGHHYFRDFFFCDSGMIPWLLLWELMSVTGEPLSALIRARREAFPCPDELNFRITSVPQVLEAVYHHYCSQAREVDRFDGLSMSFSHWRFNLRASDTEPLLRLNLETRVDKRLLAEKTAELSGLIKRAGFCGD